MAGNSGWTSSTVRVRTWFSTPVEDQIGVVPQSRRSLLAQTRVSSTRTRGGVSRNLYWEVLPLRFPHLVALPLYSGIPCKRFDEHSQLR